MTLDREDWLEWRRQGIGSSDAAVIIGLSPWKSRYALWAEKTVEGLDTQDVTHSMEFGTRVEPVLNRWFHDLTDLYILGEQTLCDHPERPWMRATVDGFVAESPDTALADALGIAEDKTTGQAAEEWEKEIPDYYRAQAQWQMAVTGHDRVWFPTLHFAFGRREFHVHELERDQGDIDFLVAEAEKFWTEHILTGEPPEPDGSESTTRALKAAWTGERGQVCDLTTHARVVDRWKRAKADQKQIEWEVAELENELRALMKKATEGQVDGETVMSWRPQSRTAIDGKGLREAHPDIAAAFTTTTTIRVLRPHTPKEN